MSKGSQPGGEGTKSNHTQTHTEPHAWRSPRGEGEAESQGWPQHCPCPVRGDAAGRAARHCLQSHRWQLSLLWPSGPKLWKLGKRSKHEAFFFFFFFFLPPPPPQWCPLPRTIPLPAEPEEENNWDEELTLAVPGGFQSGRGSQGRGNVPAGRDSRPPRGDDTPGGIHGGIHPLLPQHPPGFEVGLVLV